MSTSISDDVVATALPPVTQSEKSVRSGNETYGQILKSSVLVGGSSAINIVIRVVRTKAMAFLLGPAGFGLFGLYWSVENLVETIAGVGVNSSGVRQIAEAVGSGDMERIAQTAAVLRRTSFVLGAVGAFLLIVFSRPVSRMTFGDTRHSWALCLLSVAVFFQLVSYGQAALIQGMRRIADLAKTAVLGTLSGTILSIPVVYFLREKGVVISLVIVAAMTILPTWWYSRKIEIHVPRLTASQIVQETIALLRLGSVFMVGGLLLTGVAYLVRILILRRVGFEAAGLYQSAWTLGGLYVGLIIQAMAADFYPRLTASAKDDLVCNRLVNEQARVGLLLAGPGVLATLTFAPIVIELFYTAKFGPAVGVLRWICLGTTLQVITWPMGFIIVAKGRQAVFFWCELACAAVYAALVWICVSSFGLQGAGIAFFAYCVFHGLLHYPIARWLSGFQWSPDNHRTGLLFLVLIAGLYGGFYVLPRLLADGLGTLATIGSGIYSLRILSNMVSWRRIPRPLQRLMAGFGFAPRILDHDEEGAAE
jgi:O-antigen/teichoic acid export membrane protein